MSRQNKVNPGQYTQRGRLTPDDAARELKRQRSMGSEHTWQPVQKDQMPAASAKKAAKTAKPKAKAAATKTARKAVLARNVGGGSQPRPAAKRRKS